MFSYFKKFDWPLTISVLIMAGMGLLSIYSSSLGNGDDLLNFKKQAIFLSIGFLFMIFSSFFDYRNLKENSYLILILYSLCLLALGGLLLFGHPIRGVRSWYRIGSVSLSPVEFTKVILIIILAKYFSARHIEMYKFYHIILSGLYVVVPAFLVYLQPDLGSVLVLILLWAGILMVSGIRLKHFLILGLCAILLFCFSWIFLFKDYQKERIISFATPEYQPLEIGWSQKQAKIAIGNGGMLGKGIGQGSQTQYGFLTEPQTDFIFSAIAEEFGFLAIFILSSLFLFFFWRLIRIALYAGNNFSRIFVLGVGIVVIAQFFINIGTNIGFLPVIGIPLPFVSYGGSSLLALFICLGILQNIKINS
ncbi:MAG: FtsW/RodA/SpoVE family cell cycle protein [Patescibacteria group bacterium]|nr:FtsW/RodA/SpoVE family cell cycle protein [Patescibacteria group bacterium]